MVQVINNEIYIMNELIQNPSVIIDVKSGLLKHGERDSVKHYYDTMLKTYDSICMADIVRDLVFVDLSESELTKLEVATLLNYMITVSGNADNINKLIKMGTEELKSYINMLNSLGF